jgi:hypothetical protein
VTFHHLDISQAYLWATLDTPVYMKPVAGMNVPTGHCLKLLRALYGLRGSSTAWYRTFVAALVAAPLCYIQSQFDQCVFYCSRGAEFLIILPFVDDMLIFTNSGRLKRELVKRCNKLFAVDDRGEAKWFLAIQIDRNIAEAYVDLSQERYCEDLVRKALGDDPVPVKAPETKEVLSKAQCPQNDDEIAEMANFPFREHAGRLMYNMTMVRPCIMHALKCVLQFSSNPGPAHKRALLRIVRYVAGCTGAKLRLHGSRDYRVTLGVICDADDANNPDHRRSINCVFSFLGEYFVKIDGICRIGTPAFFAWNSAWTLYVAESSCVSELYAIATALRSVKFFRPFLDEIALVVSALGDLRQIEATPILSDCNSAVLIAQGGHPARFKGTKHVERRFFSVQQAIALLLCKMLRASSTLNCADIGATFKDVANFLQQRLVVMANDYGPPKRPFKIEQRPKRG